MCVVFVTFTIKMYLELKMKQNRFIYYSETHKVFVDLTWTGHLSIVDGDSDTATH